MENSDDFKINYWAPKDYIYKQKPQEKRSFKKKLLIVICFIAVLIITPSLFYGLSNINNNSLSQLSKIDVTPTPKRLAEVIKKQPTSVASVVSQTNKKEVINNDSYWKISKRNCGTGKYYLSIQDQNGAKPLYKGETVKVTCELN